MKYNDSDVDRDTRYLTPPRGDGRRPIQFDFDGVPVPEWFRAHFDPGEFNPSQLDNGDRLLRRLVDHVIRTELPEPFHEASCCYHFSSSAGFKPWWTPGDPDDPEAWKPAAAYLDPNHEVGRTGPAALDESDFGIRVHIWFWLDEPVCFESLRTDPRIDLDDEPPQRHGWITGDEFDVDGQYPLPVQPQYTADPVCKQRGRDPLIELRMGVIEKDIRHPDITPTWGVPRSEWERLEARRADIEQQRQESRETITVDTSTGTNHTEIRVDVDDGDAETAALRALQRAVDRVEAADRGDRYETCFDQASLVGALVTHGQLDPKHHATIMGAVEACLDDEPSNVRGIRESTEPRDDPADLPPALRTIDLSDADDSSTTDATIYDNLDDGQLDGLAEARERVERAIRSALDDETSDVHALVAAPATGKTRAAIKRAIDLWDNGESSRIVVPTNALGKEIRERVRGRIGDRIFWPRDKRWAAQNQVVVRPKRTEASCKRSDVVHKANDRLVDGANSICGQCPHNPDTDEPADTCNYMKMVARYQHRSQGPRIEISTHALEADESPRGDGDRPVEIMRDDIQNTVVPHTRAAPLSPTLHRRPETLGLTVEVDHNGGVELPEPLVDGGNYGVDWDDPDDVLTFWEWFATLVGAESNHLDDIKRSARERLDVEAPLAFQYIDESPLGACVDTVEVSRDDIERAVRADHGYDIDPMACQKLLSQLGKLARTDEPGTSALHGPHLSSLMPPGTIGKPEGTGVQPDDPIDARDPAADDHLLNQLDELPHLRALRALHRASQREFAGSYAYRDPDRDGLGDEIRMVLRVHRHISPLVAETTVVGDATGDPATVEALMGDDVARHEVPVEPPETSQLTQFHGASLAKFAPTVDGFGFDRLRASIEHAESRSGITLHVVPKAYRRDEHGQFRDYNDERAVRRLDSLDVLHEADHGGRVIHHAGEASRGSDRFATADTICVSDFYVPGDAKQALSAALRDRAPADAPDPDRFERAAEIQLELAPIVQAMHRARPLLGDTEILFLSDRQMPAPLGGDTDRISSGRLCIARGTAVPNGRLTGGMSPPEAAAALLQLVVRALDGICVPMLVDGLDHLESPEGTITTSTLSPIDGLDPREARQAVDQLDDPWGRLCRKVKAHWGGSWNDAADAAGLDGGTLSTDGTATIGAVVNPDRVDGGLDVETLARVFEARADDPPAYIRFDNETKWVAPDVADRLRTMSDDQLARLVELPVRSRSGGASMAAEYADGAEVSKSTARRRIRQVFGGADEFREYVRTFMG
jgi:hypothetical protein